MSAVEKYSDPQPLRFAGADCVAFVGDDQTHSVVSSVAGEFFDAPVVRDGDTSDALAFLTEAPAPKVLIVDIGDNSSPLSAMLSLTTAATEETRLIGIGEINDISLYRELTGAGVTDYLVKPVSEKALSIALERAEEPLGGPAAQPVAGETRKVVVIGARGGVGGSTVAVNLAWLFTEEHGLSATLVDLDLEFGTVALSLDLEPTRGLREALENPARIDSLFVSSATAKVNDKFSVMATEENLAGEIAFASDAIEVLFETLGKTNDCIVVDLPRPSFGIRHQTLAAATHVVLVTELGLSGLRDTIRLLGNIEEAAPKAKVIIVGNHGGSDQQAMRLPDFQKALGRKVDLIVPDEPKAFNEAANTGKPVVQFAARSKAAKALQKLGADIMGKKVKSKGKAEGKKEKASGQKKSLFGLGKRS
ncbi:MAG: AAA family ATPase [Rhodospirillales bacterium]|nr:AAA family ATPase [Rhodospirillales bacterium]